MDIGVVSKRYAKALLAYAKAQGKEDTVYNEVRLLAGHLMAVPELRRALENPILDVQRKMALLCEAARGTSVSEELQRFFQLVLEAKREKFLQFMAWSYIDLYREDKHIFSGRLITAVPSERLVKHLSELIGERTHGTVEIEARTDESLIGGYIIELDGFRLDASVQNQLKRVRQQFLARNKRIV